MSHEFELSKEIELDASPEQVWQAIATGPGLTSWFMTHEVEPGEGGVVRLKVPGFTVESAITAWEPPTRFVVAGESQAFEYLIEGRDGGSTVLRFVQSGFLGDDWESEYDSMAKGWDMYFHTLGQYLRYFPGRTATFVLADGPEESAREEAWAVLMDAVGGPAAVGDKVHFATVDGVVDYLTPNFLGVRGTNGLYRFHGRAALGMPIGVGHHIFGGDEDSTEEWRIWLTGLYRQNQ